MFLSEDGRTIQIHTEFLFYSQLLSTIMQGRLFYKCLLKFIGQTHRLEEHKSRTTWNSSTPAFPLHAGVYCKVFST
jgi:hypothetical protein